MANINVVVDKTIADGYKLKFRTPCESTTVEGLEVKYPAKNGVGTLIKKFVFKDAHGTELSGVGNLFVSGVMIEVLLDVTHGVAYIQNADTNSYVESFKGEIARLEESQKQFLSVAGKVIENAESAAKNANGAAENANGAAAGVLTIEQNNGELLRFWVGTQEEYEALADKDATCFYMISDDQTVDDLEKTLTNHINDTAYQTDTIAQHTSTIAQHTSTISQHTATIAQHDDKIIAHNTELAKQDARIDALEANDYIVEQDTKYDIDIKYDDLGIKLHENFIRWHWRKWNSGRFELWGRHNINTTIDAPAGALYNSGIIEVELPFKAYTIRTFADCIDSTVWGTTCTTENVNDNMSSDYFKYILYRHSIAYMHEWYVNLYATGMWK